MYKNITLAVMRLSSLGVTDVSKHGLSTKYIGLVLSVISEGIMFGVSLSSEPAAKSFGSTLQERVINEKAVTIFVLYHLVACRVWLFHLVSYSVRTWG